MGCSQMILTWAGNRFSHQSCSVHVTFRLLSAKVKSREHKKGDLINWCQAIIKRVLLAEAQHRRLHSAFGWIIPKMFWCLSSDTLTCVGIGIVLNWCLCTGKKKQNKEKIKEQEKIAVTKVHTIGDCELRSLLMTRCHSLCQNDVKIRILYYHILDHFQQGL